MISSRTAQNVFEFTRLGIAVVTPRRCPQDRGLIEVEDDGGLVRRLSQLSVGQDDAEE
jgi:hypothetical protein